MLLIVESPNKCAKIQSILDKQTGKGKWVVMASVGHIRDLPKNELSVDRANSYKPTYEISVDKQKVVKNLREAVRQNGPQQVYLATDEDREGEAIAFHLCLALGLDINTTKRVTFNEITESAIQKAIANPRTIQKELVAAQECRRVLDRLFGYEVSSVLTQKLGEKLTAGRVQSVALRLVVDRERTIRQFKPTFTYRVKGRFITAKNEVLPASFEKAFSDQQSLEGFFKQIPGKNWQVTDIAIEQLQQNPKPPFTTSSLQMDAIRKFNRAKNGGKWSAKKVMEVAQKLFEQGHITYMRTDSPNLSPEAVAEIQQELIRSGKGSYFQQRQFKAKASAQEAHEAIRPTHFEEKTAGTTVDEQLLYRLIYNRALASQMKPALFEQTTIQIEAIGGLPQGLFLAKAKIPTYDGFLSVYREEDEEETEGEDQPVSLSGIRKGQQLDLIDAQGRQTFTQPPKRFDEALLVAELEKRGIGRPSTYANTISGIISREYVVPATVASTPIDAIVYQFKKSEPITRKTEKQAIGGDKNKLGPSDTGFTIIGFLEQFFGAVVDYSFTAGMEKNLDEIVERRMSYVGVLSGFDQQHQRMLTEARKLPDREREGVPIVIGQLDGNEVKAGMNRKTGSIYVLVNDQFYTVEGVSSPKQVTLELATKAIAQKAAQTQQRQQNTLRTLNHKNKTYTILQGQYGLYVTDGTESASLKHVTTQQQIDAFTAEELQKLIKEAVEYRKNRSKTAPPARAKTSSTKTRK